MRLCLFQFLSDSNNKKASFGSNEKLVPKPAVLVTELLFYCVEDGIKGIVPTCIFDRNEASIAWRFCHFSCHDF